MENSPNLQTISAKFNEEILRKVVDDCYKKKTGKNAPEIVTHSVSYASGKGDGYMGVVYRVKVDLKGDMSINLIGKGMPDNIARRKTFHCEKFFANEVFFFNEIVPAFRELETEKRGEEFKNSFLSIPDCYYALSDGVNDFLILEDLGDEGYSNADRRNDLTVNQVNEMLKIFGRLHAFSLALNHCYPDKFKKLSDQATETLFHRKDCLWTERYIALLAKYFKLAVGNDLSTKYIQKFENFVKPETFYQKVFAAIENRDCKSVFNHGDTWVTNFMFKENVIKSIDFQLVRYGSPMLDVSTIIFACTNQDVRDKLGGAKGMFELYLSELNHTVTSLGAPQSQAGITIEEMTKLWPQFGVLGFGFTMELVQLSLIDDSDVQDLDRFEGEEAVTLADITPFAEIKSKEGKKRVTDLLRFAVDEGIL